MSSRRAVTSWSIPRHHGRRRPGAVSSAAAGDIIDDDDDVDDDSLHCFSLPVDIKPPEFFLTPVSSPFYETIANETDFLSPIHTADADETKLSSLVASAVCT